MPPPRGTGSKEAQFPRLFPTASLSRRSAAPAGVMDAAARLPPGSKLPLPHSSCWARPRRFLGMAIRRNRDGAEGPRAPAVCCQRLLLPYHQEPPTRIRAAGQRTDKRLPCRGGHVGSLAVESIQRSRSPAQTAGVVDPDPQLLLMEAVILSCLENNARSLTEEEIPVDFRCSSPPSMASLRPDVTKSLHCMELRSLQWTEDRLETPGERRYRGSENGGGWGGRAGGSEPLRVCRLEVGCRLFSSPTFARITTALIMVEGGFQVRTLRTRGPCPPPLFLKPMWL